MGHRFFVQRRLAAKFKLPGEEEEEGEDESDKVRKELAELTGIDYKRFYPPAPSRPKAAAAKSSGTTPSIALTDIRLVDDESSFFDLSEASRAFDQGLDKKKWHAVDSPALGSSSSSSSCCKAPTPAPAEPPLLDPVLKPKRKPRKPLPKLTHLKTELYGKSHKLTGPLYSWPRTSSSIDLLKTIPS